MNEACAAPADYVGFLTSMTRFIDCQSQMLGAQGWLALSAPGSSLSALLTGFLTIAVALIGYNLLIGTHFTLRSGLLTVVKIGAILAFAMSWAAYRTIVYDVIVSSPTQIANEIGTPAGIPGADGTLTNRLDSADRALTQLQIAGTGPRRLESELIAPPPFEGFNSFALGSSRILFALTAICGLGIVRIISGILLALGPFFIAFLMFESTRSLFEGWIRVLAGAALGALGSALALGLQLSLMEPWLVDVLTRRAAGESLPGMPAELFVITIVFAIATVAVLGASGRLAGAFRLHWFGRSLALHDGAGSASDQQAVQVSRAENPQGRSRAGSVAEAVVHRDRRGTSPDAAQSTMRTRFERQTVNDPREQPRDRIFVPVGRSHRTRLRSTATARRRDQSL